MTGFFIIIILIWSNSAGYYCNKVGWNGPGWWARSTSIVKRTVRLAFSGPTKVLFQKAEALVRPYLSRPPFETTPTLFSFLLLLLSILTRWWGAHPSSAIVNLSEKRPTNLISRDLLYDEHGPHKTAPPLRLCKRVTRGTSNIDASVMYFLWTYPLWYEINELG